VAQAVGRDTAPLAQQIAMAETVVRDLDGRIAQLNDMVKAATAKARTKTAVFLSQDQTGSRADLVGQRQAAAGKLADLRVQQTDIEMHR
jgi:hypothetical protein